MSNEKTRCKFVDACEEAKKISNLDNQTLGYLYGHYKQATVGDCNIPSPSIWDIKNKAKYQAWKELHGMSSELAMTNYTKKVKELKKAERV